jgi:16S rRNA (uracil1498-N3)-methyltransferase
MAERFYLNCPLELGPIQLEGAEAHHLTVCRLRPGDHVCLFNGDGRQFRAIIQDMARRSVNLEIVAVESPVREHRFRLEVAAPLPKGDRAQFLLEKLTELGVTTFIPLRTRRSVVHPGEGKLDKLERHVIEASKQCGRNALLIVESLTDWEVYCKRNDLPDGRVLAHPGGSSHLLPQNQDLALAVGPEGGFEEEEVALAGSFGWQIADLGPRILRIETAALVLVAQSLSARGIRQSGA